MMLGAVIGSLAAWTWEHDRNCFWERLVSPDAKLSGYGGLALELWPTIQEGGLIHKSRLYPRIGKVLIHNSLWCNIPDDWRIWGGFQYETSIPFDLKIALISASFIDSGFLPESRQKELNWVTFFHGGKQEYYASNIMAILKRLREGKTKKEAIKDIPECVFNWYKTGTPHKWKDYLEYVTFAWRCFYYSFDYTSAIHNAVKCTGNRYLAAFLTGAFAGAMYGYDYCMTKLKYGGNHIFIEIPRVVNKEYGSLINEIRTKEFNERFFFPKNDALANVDIHKWHDIENSFTDYKIDARFREKIMRAFRTDWENRYGIYLDDGWFYVYRSHCILYRFKLTKLSPDEWIISDLQKSDDAHGEMKDIREALISANNGL